MIWAGKPTDLDVRYRYFGIYMAEYLEVRDFKYSADQDEAIGCLMTKQSEQGR